jgi:predicted nucleotide-binding protein
MKTDFDMQEKLKDLIEEGKQVRVIDRAKKQQLSNSGIADLSPVGSGLPEFDTWVGNIKIFISRYLPDHPLKDDLFDEMNKRKYSAILGKLEAIARDDEAFESQSEISSATPIKNTVQNNKIFIVHGHDDLARKDTENLILRLGLEPIILNDQPNNGKTIIEKIEKYDDVGYAIILYTPCDVGRKAKGAKKLNPRARQNVIFEHGYFVGILGRDHVAVLKKADIEKPSDIDGLGYISMDVSGHWKNKLIEELQEVGFNVSKDMIKG